MSETTAVSTVAFSGPAGPDSLRIPAEPNRLTQAGQQLGDLADQLAQAGEHLTGGSAGHEDRQGHTTSALVSVATWNGKRLGKDAVLLRELGGAVDQAARVIGDLQAQDLPQLRRRWGQAQDQFLGEMRGVADQDAQERQQAERQAQQQAQRQAEQQAQDPALRQAGQGPHGGGDHGGGHHAGAAGGGQELAATPLQPDHRPALPNPHQLLQHLDDQLLQPYADLFRELGQHLTPGGGGADQAFLSDARTEHAVSSYRQAVRSVLDEFAHLVQRVQQVDRAVQERCAYPAADRADDEHAEAMVSGGSATVSGVESLRLLVQDLRAGAEANGQAHDRLRQIGSALDDGRLPAARGQEREHFGADWTQHFQRRAERLRTVCSRVDDVLEKFDRIDAECAAAIRAH